LADPRETVGIEHQDRRDQLLRRMQEQGVWPAPVLQDFVVPAERMPAGFKVDTPVLRVIFSERVFFDTDRSEIRPEAEPILRAIAKMLAHDVPDVAVFVAGHADNRGSNDHNTNLSIRRADSVADRLFRYGIGQSQLGRVGFGESMPLYANDSEETMGFNRRIELLIAAKSYAVVQYLMHISPQQVCYGLDRVRSEKCLVAAPKLQSVAIKPITPGMAVTGARRQTKVSAPGAGPQAVPGGGVQVPAPGGADQETAEADASQETIIVQPGEQIILNYETKTIVVGRPTR
jgi:outer membrane protein OmpA-like peptidoglycan-associated protein